MPFDPTKPFTVVEEIDSGGFDPSKPFTVVAPDDARETRRAELAAQQREIAANPTPLLGRLASRAYSGLESGINTPERLVRGGLDLVGFYGALDAVTGSDGKYQRNNADWLRYFNEREQVLAQQNARLGDAGFVGDLAEAATRGVVELPTQLAGGAAGAVRGAAVKGAALTAGTTSGLSQYAQDRGAGRGRVESAAYGGLSGAITGLTTRAFGDTGVESVFRNEGIKGISARILNTLKQAGLEGAEEAVDQFQQELLARSTREPNKPIADSVYDVLLAGSVGTLIGGGVSGANQIAQAAIQPNEISRPRTSVPTPRAEGEIQTPSQVSAISRFTADPEAAVETQARATQPRGPGALENPEAEALAAQDRVTAAVADRQPISGQDARLAGARDRMADMSYVFVEDQDVYVPVRPTGRTSRARQMISRGDLTAVQPLAEEARPIAGTPETPAPTPEPATPATTPKVSDDELQVAVQSKMTLGKKEIPGYVQVDSMVGGQNQWSSNPTKLRAEGYDMPTQEELLKLPQGKYTLTEAKRRLAEIEANEKVQPEPSGQPQQAPAVARPAEPATPAAPAVNRPSGETAAAPAATSVVASPVAATQPKATPERIRRINIQDEGVQVVFPDVAHTELFALPSRFSTLTKGKKTPAGEVTKAIQRAEKAFGLNGQAAVMQAARAYRDQVVGMARTSIDSGATTFNAPARPTNLGTTQAAEATPTTKAPTPAPPTAVPTPETAASETTPAAANPPAEAQKFRVGASPQTWTLVERLTPTAAERQNSEQPMRVRNDRTGTEEVVLESDMTPVRERTTEEKAAKPKRKTKAQLDKQLRDAGMDPSAFNNADEKRNALDRAADKIAELQKKLRGSRSTVSMGVPKAILDLALETARLALRGGSTLIQAIDSAINVIRERMGADFNPEVESNVRENITNELSTTEEEGQRQQFFGAEIGEVKEEIESVQAITTALKDNGYEVGDRVTEDNTANAWRLFTAFTDPKVRAQTIADLRAAVPQEMAAGILHSQLWKYAIRMSAKGDASLFRAMAQNSNQFVLTDGPAFRSTLGRALRALRLGADFTTWKNELERVKAQKAAIAKELGVEVSLIDQLIENLNGADVDAAAVERTVGQTKLPGGETVQEVLDENEQAAPDPTQEESTAIDDEAQEEQMSRADKTASEILRRLELDYAGVEWLKEGTAARDQIRRILREHYRGREPIVPIQGNTNRVIKALSSKFQAVAGVSEEIADQLAFAAETKRQTDWTNARNRLISRASRSRKLTGLIEEIKATPYLTQSDPNWIRETAQDWFMSNGLSREQASAAAEVFQNEFRAKLLEAQTKIAERMLAKSKPESVKEFVAALRAGVLDPEKPWVEAYAEKAGFKSPTNAQFKQLAELELRLQEPDLTAPERAEIGEKMMGIYLHLKLPPPVMQRIAANFVVTNLTGLRTMTVNVFAPLTRLLTERALATIARPQDALRNIQQLWEAYKDFPRRVKFSLTKDAYTFINNEFEQSTNEIRRIWETGLKDLQSDSKLTRVKGATKLIYGSQQFVMRLLNAVDQAGAVTEREVQMANYATEAFRRSGLSSNQTTELVQAVSRLKRQAFEDGVEGGMTPDQARIHSDEVAIEQLEDFVRERAGDTPEAHTMARKAAEAAEKDAYSAIGRLAPGVQEEMEGGVVSRLIYHNILRLASRLRGGKGADPILGVSLLGYVSIPFRTARFIAWNTPYGLLRLGINKYRKSRGLDSWWKQSLANEYQERHRLKMALTGSAVLAVMSGLGAALLGLSSDDEAGDDKFGIYITGAGPKNKNLKDSWEKSGFRPNSINIIMGGKPTSIPLTRIGEPLAHYAWILAARDDYGWRKREAEAAGKKLDETWTAQVGHSLGTYVGLLGQRGILQNISQWAKIGSGEGGTEKAIADIATRLAASAALPWLGMQRSILDIVQGRVDRSSIQSTMAANFGIPGLAFQKRAVNRFGDPVSNQTWFGKIANTGVPLAFQVADTDENQRFYRTLAQKGAAPSELRRYVLEDRFGPLTDDQFAEFSRRSGAVLKQSVTRNLAAIEKMTPEAAKEYLTKATVQADRTAAAAMGLKREQPSASSGSSATPVPRAPAATLSTAPRASAGRARSLSRRPRGFALRTPRARSSLATMRTPRLRTSRARASISRPRRISASRARSSLSTRRRTRTSLLR